MHFMHVVIGTCTDMDVFSQFQFQHVCPVLVPRGTTAPVCDTQGVNVFDRLGELASDIGFMV